MSLNSFNRGCLNHMAGTLRYVYVPLSSFSGICRVHSHQITSTEFQQRKGINCTPYKIAGSRSNTRSCKMRCPHLTAQSPYLVLINTGFLNKCYSDLPFSVFSTKKCYCSLAMVEIYLDKFMLLADSLSSLFNYPLRDF